MRRAEYQKLIDCVIRNSEKPEFEIVRSYRSFERYKYVIDLPSARIELTREERTTDYGDPYVNSNIRIFVDGILAAVFYGSTASWHQTIFRGDKKYSLEYVINLIEPDDKDWCDMLNDKCFRNADRR